MTRRTRTALVALRTFLLCRLAGHSLDVSDPPRLDPYRAATLSNNPDFPARIEIRLACLRVGCREKRSRFFEIRLDRNE